MTTLRKKIAHIRHKRMDEGALRDVLMEIRDVKKPMMNYDKQANRSLAEISKWATTQPEEVATLLTNYDEMEKEISDAFTGLIVAYERYSHLWENILSERKELNALVDQHRKAVKSVNEAKKNVKSAEKKEKKEASKETLSPPKQGAGASPRMTRRDRKNTLVFATEALTEATEKERTLARQVMDKRLEVQRQIHSDLRQALHTMCKARLEYAHLLTKAIDKGLVFVRKFTTVKSIKGYAPGAHSRSPSPEKATREDTASPLPLGDVEEDDIPENIEFEPSPFEEELEQLNQVWYQGELYKKMLDIERNAARAALETEHKKRDQLKAELEEKHRAEIVKLTGELHSIEEKHENLLSSIKAASQEKEATLAQKVEQLTAENHELKDTKSRMSALIDFFLKTTLPAMAAAGAAALEKDGAVLLDAAVTDLLSKAEAGKDVDQAPADDIIKRATAVARLGATIGQLIMGYATTLPLPKARHLMTEVKHVTDSVTAVVHSASNASGKPINASIANDKEAYAKLYSHASLLNKMLTSIRTSDGLPEDLASEVTKAQSIIEDALALIASLREEIEAGPDTRRKTLNLALLDAAKTMMKKGMEFVKAGGNIKTIFRDADTADAMLENRKWLGALQDGVGHIVENVPFWLECLRLMVKEGLKYDELQVGTRTLAAASAQLLAVARNATYVPDKDAENCVGVIKKNSESLVVTSHGVLSAAREVNNLLLANVVLEDLDKLSENQAKKMVMATQIEALRLEKALQDEQEKLRRLRRLSYFSDQDASSSSKSSK